MKLTYRGASYNYNPPAVETSNSETVGKYRGLDVRFRNPVKKPVLQTNLDLMYRGATYHVGETPAIAAPVEAPIAEPVVVVVSTPAQAPVLNLEDKARSKMMDHSRYIKRRQQAMLSRLDAEVGLTAQNAAGYWNRIQGKIHPTFRATYDRSHAAMS